MRRGFDWNTPVGGPSHLILIRVAGRPGGKASDYHGWMSNRPKVPIWAKIVGTTAFAAAIGMLVWAVFDLVNGKGVSEVVIDVFIAIVVGGIGATLWGLWRGGRGPVAPKAQDASKPQDTPKAQDDDSPRR